MKGNDSLEGILSPFPRKQLGMDEVRQKFRSVYHPRPRPGKIRACVHGKNPAQTNRRQILPTGKVEELGHMLQRLLQIKAAGTDDHHFRCPFEDVVPWNSYGVLSLAGEQINTAGQFDHLRYPMAAAVDRVDPFHTKDAWTIG